VPPLRDRPGDILPLTEHFLRVHGQRCGVDDPTLSAEVVQKLLDHDWPGNVRELENVLHRAVLTSRDGLIGPADLSLQAGQWRQLPEPAAAAAPLGSDPLERALLPLFERGGPELYEKIVSAVVIQAYHFCDDNQVQTANLLGISRNVLRARLAMSGLIAGRRDKKPGVLSSATVSTHVR
jgi:sigma-54-specific transcriptional regulator